MDPITVILIVVTIAALGAAAWYYIQQRRRDHLRRQFGPEYERVVKERGRRTDAERELAAREERVRHFAIRAIPEHERSEFVTRWRRIQADFVDTPSEAIRAADGLVVELMQALGYPVAEFEQRVADISVDHGYAVDDYRTARQLAQRNREGTASTEDLRQAMVHYRALFNDLLHTDTRTAEVAR